MFQKRQFHKHDSKLSNPGGFSLSFPSSCNRRIRHFSPTRLRHYTTDELLQKHQNISLILRGIVSEPKRKKIQNELKVIKNILTNERNHKTETIV